MGHNPTCRGMLSNAATVIAPTSINASVVHHYQSPTEMETAPVAPRNPDARLIRMCAERIGIDAEQEAIWSPFYDVVVGMPTAAEQARSEALSARSAEGREAKARVLLMMVGGATDNDDPHEAMARSLTLDVLP